MQAHGALHAGGAQQLALPDPKNLRILVIDSKAVSRQTTTQLLRECLYQVTAVKTAREGLQLLMEAEHGAGFDLVLKEHEPPAANACRLLKRMAKTGLQERTPVVVTSTQDERETVMSCLSLGAIDYLIKPLRQNEVRHIWTRVWWWHKSQGQHGPAAHAQRHYAFRGPSSGNRQYEATSSDSKQTKCQEEEEPTSKEGSAPDNGNGNGSKGNGSNGSKEGNGTSRVDAKPHCDIKDTGHGSNGNGHGSNNGNGHGSNGNGSNGSSDNKNGGNGNSATKGDGNGHGSNGNGASTTLAADRHYQALVNTAEGKMPPNMAANHDTLQGLAKGGTVGRSSAFAQYTGPSTSSRKRAATSEALQPGTREHERERAREQQGEAGGGGGGAGGSGAPMAEGIATGGGGGSGGLAPSRSKSVQRERERERERERSVAALRGSSAGGHLRGTSEGAFQQTPSARGGAAGRSAAGGSGGGAGGSGGGPASGSGAAANGSSYNVHQPTLSSERPGSQGISPSHYASLQTQTQTLSNGGNGGGSRSGAAGGQQAQQPRVPVVAAAAAAAAAAAVGWPAGLPPHPLPHGLPHPLAALAPLAAPPGLPAPFPAMFTGPFGLTPSHLLPSMAHPVMRFGPHPHPSVPGSGSHGGNRAPLEKVQLQPTHAHAAVLGGSHALGPALGALPGGGADGPAGPAAVAPPPPHVVPPPPAPTPTPTSGATNLNAILLNQLLASGVTLQAFLGHQQPPLGLHHPQGAAQPGSRVPSHPHGHAHPHPHPHAHPGHVLPQQQAVAAAAAAAAAAAVAWRPPAFTPAGMAAAVSGILPFPGAPGLPPGHTAAAGLPMPPDVGGAPSNGGIGGAGPSGGTEIGADGLARVARQQLPGMPEPSRRRALALDKYRKKRKNLRFSKTIRYEARKQLAQQRPRVRGQFIKHGPGGPGSGMELGEDGAAQNSNGAKSGTGGAGGVADGDGGGEEEVHTNSRGYYEEEDYDNDEEEAEEETEAEPDDMDAQMPGMAGPAPLPLQVPLQIPLQMPVPLTVALPGPLPVAAALATQPLPAMQQAAQAQKSTGAADDMEVDRVPVEVAAGGAAAAVAGIAGGGTLGGTASAAALRGHSGGGGSGAAAMEEDEATVVVRNLLGLRDPALMRTRQLPDPDVVPALLKEAKACRSAGSQSSHSRDKGHSRERDRDRAHSHGHSHSQQHGAASQGQGQGTAAHGHSRPARHGGSSIDAAAAGAPLPQLRQASPPHALQPQAHGAAGAAHGLPPLPAASILPVGAGGHPSDGAGGGAAMQQPQPQQQTLYPAGPQPPGGIAQRAVARTSSQQPQAAAQLQGAAAAHGPAAGAAGGGRGSAHHSGERERERERERDRERDRDRERERERERERDREGGACGGGNGGNGKNGSDSGSNSPDENGAGGAPGGGGRAKGGAEKGGHGGHKGGGGHGHGHR